MSGSEIYHLTWNEYHTSLANSVGNLRDDASFVDVTLACDKRNFGAHKVILSACSPYFNRLLKKHVHPHPVFVLIDIDGDILASLLTFMYNGGVDIPKEKLSLFITAASLLEIKGLSDSAEDEREKAAQNLHKTPSTNYHSNEDSQQPKRPRFSQNSNKRIQSPPSPSASYSSSKYSGGAESSGPEELIHSSAVTEISKNDVEESKGHSSGDDLTTVPVKQESFIDVEPAANSTSDMMVLPGPSSEQFPLQSSVTDAEETDVKSEVECKEPLQIFVAETFLQPEVEQAGNPETIQMTSDAESENSDMEVDMEQRSSKVISETEAKSEPEDDGDSASSSNKKLPPERSKSESSNEGHNEVSKEIERSDVQASNKDKQHLPHSSKVKTPEDASTNTKKTATKSNTSSGSACDFVSPEKSIAGGGKESDSKKVATNTSDLKSGEGTMEDTTKLEKKVGARMTAKQVRAKLSLGHLVKVESKKNFSTFPMWQMYEVIVDSEDKEVGFISCRGCERIFKTTTNKTKHILKCPFLTKLNDVSSLSKEIESGIINRELIEGLSDSFKPRDAAHQDSGGRFTAPGSLVTPTSSSTPSAHAPDIFVTPTSTSASSAHAPDIFVTPTSTSALSARHSGNLGIPSSAMIGKMAAPFVRDLPTVPTSRAASEAQNAPANNAEQSSIQASRLPKSTVEHNATVQFPQSVTISLVKQSCSKETLESHPPRGVNVGSRPATCADEGKCQSLPERVKPRAIAPKSDRRVVKDQRPRLLAAKSKAKAVAGSRKAAASKLVSRSMTPEFIKPCASETLASSRHINQSASKNPEYASVLRKNSEPLRKDEEVFAKSGTGSNTEAGQVHGKLDEKNVTAKERPVTVINIGGRDGMTGVSNVLSHITENRQNTSVSGENPVDLMRSIFDVLDNTGTSPQVSHAPGIGTTDQKNILHSKEMPGVGKHFHETKIDQISTQRHSSIATTSVDQQPSINLVPSVSQRLPSSLDIDLGRKFSVHDADTIPRPSTTITNRSERVSAVQEGRKPSASHIDKKRKPSASHDVDLIPRPSSTFSKSKWASSPSPSKLIPDYFKKDNHPFTPKRCAAVVSDGAPIEHTAAKRLFVTPTKFSNPAVSKDKSLSKKSSTKESFKIKVPKLNHSDKQHDERDKSSYGADVSLYGFANLKRRDDCKDRHETSSVTGVSSDTSESSSQSFYGTPVNLSKKTHPPSFKEPSNRHSEPKRLPDVECLEEGETIDEDDTTCEVEFLMKISNPKN